MKGAVMLDHCAFNGDADGLCARQQLRLAGELDPNVQLVSGVKRDIALLGRHGPWRKAPAWAHLS